ncbi:hypothetical protein DFJ77DRAFT_472920 [Powellomyces hirtus]|nr:hypothetical protein DFJ77DRAFT_472920 [Powellomyces hirtus]
MQHEMESMGDSQHEQLLPSPAASSSKKKKDPIDTVFGSWLNRMRPPTRRHFFILGVTALTGSLILVLAFLNPVALGFRRVPEFRPIQSPNELLHRLKGQTVYFIGDSVTRYQYNQLVYYLETGIVPLPSNNETLIQNKYDPVNEHSWPDWTTFFEGTTNFARQGKLTCDCYRRPEVSQNDIIENRYYHNGDVKLVYHQFFRDLGVCSMRGKTNWDKPATDAFPGWCFTLPGMVESIVNQHIQTSNSPFTLVLNAGLHVPLPKELFDHILNVFDKVETDPANKAPTKPLLIWKGTTPNKNDELTIHDNQLKLPRKSRNLKYVDTQKLFTTHFGDRKEEVYWDNLHFTADVYHVFNSAIVDLIEARHGVITDTPEGVKIINDGPSVANL